MGSPLERLVLSHFVQFQGLIRVFLMGEPRPRHQWVVLLYRCPDMSLFLCSPKIFMWYTKAMNTAVDEIDRIKETLAVLPEPALHELRAFADYLADREKRRKALVSSVLKAEQEHDSIICSSGKEAVQAILNTPDDDNEEA